MKSVFVAMRSVEVQGGATVSFPIGVFTDKADAERAASGVPRSLAAVNGTPIGEALVHIGVAGVGGQVVELPFHAGAGLVTPPEKRLIIPG